MKLKYLFVPGVFVLAAVAAEFGGFTFQRAIVGKTDGWKKIVLPDDVFARVALDLSDIRVGGKKSSGEWIEAPYVLRQPSELSETEIAFEVINKTSTDAGRFFTFRLGLPETIDRIDLTFTRPNFDWRITVEGSNDQVEWQKIVENYRIVGIVNDVVEYSFTSVRFSSSKFAYFRLFVPSTEDPGFVKASLNKSNTAADPYRKFPLRSFKVFEDKKQKQSVIEVELENKVSISRLKADIKDGFDYYRPVSIEYLAGMAKENRPIYRPAATNVLSSFDTEGFGFPEVISDRLRIIVNNQDNPPLNFTGVELSGKPYELIARFSEPAEYFLIYSRPNTPGPQYDLENFTNRIPADPEVLTLGKETPRVVGASMVEPYFQSPVWLWAVMAAAIVLLGWFSYRLLRK